eukprot:scaffold517_cov255-Pinguiococcus_pyrenoidosus.AAC.2
MRSSTSGGSWQLAGARGRGQALETFGARCCCVHHFLTTSAAPNFFESFAGLQWSAPGSPPPRTSALDGSQAARSEAPEFGARS